MTAITDLERRICALELADLGYSTVAEHAAVHVLDSTTLAVVVLCGHNAEIIEHAIRAQHFEITGIGTVQDIITVTL